MPMELGPELVTIVRSHFANAERKLFDDVANEIDGVCLRMLIVDLKGTNAGCVIDCCVLETVHLFTAFTFEAQKLSFYLDVMSRHLPLIPLGLQFTLAFASG